ncbi:SDR family oxidoreductase [Stratiformator vulcanicus]|uniref:Putative oxidoreductase n=1 Tax=Stratiformator vulcanicus TaxID=2527980 RepID=A0A517QY84_9PLAN|nr:SDR family oxidoreductase [Stratiformator vulcanicus]QDT36601.1 putative oxidoreductase [Stratiformator vulcanicus]
MSLKGMAAVITGGGSGIGAAVAVTLADAGANVLIAGRTESKLKETASRGPSGKITSSVCDVADADACETLIQGAAKDFGRLDMLINAAGINIPHRRIEETTPEEWDRLLRINASGAFYCTKAALPIMRAQRGGLIVNICSISGVRAAMLGGVSYNASKFAMNALGVSAAQEAKADGVRVTNIHPGEVETPILSQRPVAPSEEHRATMLQPEDVAAAVLMIANLPPRANVLEMVIKPTVQDFV